MMKENQQRVINSHSGVTVQVTCITIRRAGGADTGTLCKPAGRQWAMKGGGGAAGETVSGGGRVRVSRSRSGECLQPSLVAAPPMPARATVPASAIIDYHPDEAASKQHGHKSLTPINVAPTQPRHQLARDRTPFLAH